MTSKSVRPGLITLFAIAAFLSAGMMRATDVLIPMFSESFSVSLSAAGLVTSSYAIAYGLFQLFWAPLGDKYGKARVVAWVLLLSVVGNVLSAITWSFDLLVVSRILVGATSAGIIPLIYAWIADYFDGDLLSPALARISSSAIVGMIFIQSISGFIAEQYHWRWTFVGLSGALLITGIFILRSSIESATRSLLAVKPISYKAGFTAVLRRHFARWLMLITVAHGALFFGFVVYSPAYLYQYKNFGLSESALIVAMYGAGGLFYSTIIRWALRFCGIKNIIIIALASLVSAIVSITVVESRQILMILYFLLGFGYYALQNQLTTQAAILSTEYRGVAVSLFTCAMFLGISLGVTIMGVLLTHIDFGVLARLSAVGFVLVFLGFGRLVTRNV